MALFGSVERGFLGFCDFGGGEFGVGEQKTGFFLLNDQFGLQFAVFGGLDFEGLEFVFALLRFEPNLLAEVEGTACICS